MHMSLSDAWTYIWKILSKVSGLIKEFFYDVSVMFLICVDFFDLFDLICFFFVDLFYFFYFFS